MKVPFRDLWAEFKAFAFQGNMIELAVAVVIGAAFSSVIHAMVVDIINPTITYAVTAIQSAKETASEVSEAAASKVGLATTHPTTAATQAATTAPVVAVAPTPPPAAAPPPPPPAPPAPAASSEPTKAVQFQWMIGRYPIGNFIGELINFVIVAFAIFILIVKLLGGMMKHAGGTPKPGEPTTKECPECLSVIPARARRCSHCTAVLVAPPAGGGTSM